jgi:hypothetical protein
MQSAKGRFAIQGCSCLGIESGLHYRRDVPLREDSTHLKDRKAVHNMPILNDLVIGLCLANGFSNLASARRYFDAHPKTALNLPVSTRIPTL